MSAGRRVIVGIGVAYAILIAGCDSGGGGESTDTRTGSGPTMTVSIFPPSDLTAEAERVTVRLRWSPPTEGPSAQGYGIYRKGSLLQGVTGDQTTFTDDEVKPGKTYTYEVRARAGGAVSEPASVEVKVPVPPLKAARLVGDFAVSSRLVTKTGYGQFEIPTFGWHFTPHCKEGPCDVAWRDISGKNRARLHRRAGRYVGQDTGFFTTECQGTRAISSVEISLDVKKARAVAGEWRATKLVGSVESSQAPQLGCGSSSYELVVTALLRQS